MVCQVKKDGSVEKIREKVGDNTIQLIMLLLAVCWFIHRTLKSFWEGFKRPGAHFSVTFWAWSHILKSKSIEFWHSSFLPAYQPNLFYQLRILLLSFQCKHRAHKIAFWARKVTGTFAKRAPGLSGPSCSKVG